MVGSFTERGLEHGFHDAGLVRKFGQREEPHCGLANGLGHEFAWFKLLRADRQRGPEVGNEGPDLRLSRERLAQGLAGGAVKLGRQSAKQKDASVLGHLRRVEWNLLFESTDHRREQIERKP